MDRQTVFRELTLLMKDGKLRDRVLMSRGVEELDRLAGWVCRQERAVEDARDDDLKKLIESCALCAGVEDRKFSVGTGVNGVMVILNSPPLVNIIEKKLLKKESIELLKKMIQAVGLSFMECYITNLVKCDINDPLMKPSQIVKNCETIINREIEVIKPRVVIVFGDIIPLQKIIKSSREIFWYNIEHPINLIKNPELKRPAWNTLKLIMSKLKEINL
jgi:uracil-DNA glycosylase